ncbi:MAG TPA: hypothetical protein PLD84_02605 [Chitinophagales bacterium]|nr:hypothetical protein [Chitinophagales bacterium]
MAYITPSIEDISENKLSLPETRFDRTRKHVKVDDIFKEKFSFVLAMPGMGKSRLLKEIVKSSSEIFSGSLYVEAKYLNEDKYEEAINGILASPFNKVLSGQELVEKKNFHFEKPFELRGESPFLLCLDALDEVGFDHIGHHAKQLYKFIQDYPKVHIIVSCRDYIYKRIQNHFSDISVKVFQLNPFNRFSAGEFLKEFGFDDKGVSKVLQKFTTGFVQLRVIDSPRMLECFVLYKNKQGIEKALETGLPELFDFFIMESLRIEDKKNSKSDAEIKYALLRMLALCMNIYGKTEISKGEVVAFLDSVKSNIAVSYISKVNIEDLYDRALLIPNEDSVQFFNTEIQEYLASKEIIHLEKVNQTLFDVAYDSNLNEFKPFWKNTIKFIIEQEISVQSDIIDFMLHRLSSLDYSLLQLVLCDNVLKVNSLLSNTREIAFKSIVEYYCNNHWVLGYYFAEKLSLYYNSQQAIYLEQLWINGQIEKVTLSNLLALIHYLALNDNFEEKQIWRNRLKNLVILHNDFSIKDQAIAALAHFKELGEFISLYKFIESKDRGITASFLRGLNNIDPNDPRVIDLTLDAIFKFNNDLSGVTLGSISNRSGHYYLLKKMSKSEDLFNKLNRVYLTSFVDELAAQLKKYWANDISILIAKMIRKFKFQYSSKFYEMLVRTWKENEPNSIKKIAEWYLGDWIKNKVDHFKYYELLKDEITLGNAKQIASILSKIKGVNDTSLLFFRYRHLSVMDANSIFEVGKKYFNEEWELYKERINQPQEWEMTHAKRILRELEVMLDEMEGKWYPDIFKFYLNNKNILERELNESDHNKVRATIKKLINEKVLNFDFSKASITYSNGVISYSRIIGCFSSVILLLQYFNYKPSEYRSQLIAFIPFCFMSDERKQIFDVLGELSAMEKIKIINFYRNRRSDPLFKKNLSALWDLVNRYKMNEALPVIKDFIFNQDIEMGDRLKTLEVAYDLGASEKFMHEIFKTFSETKTAERQLAEKANSFLVVMPALNQAEAIKWRIQILFQKPFEYKPIDEVDHWGLRDVENSLMQILTPLSSIKNPEFSDLYLDAIKEAIKIYDRALKFQVFAFTVWESLLQYFHNLAEDGHRKPIESLQKLLGKTKEFHGYRRLENVIGKVIYVLLENDKSKNFSQCINSYNELKSRIYLPITSDKDFQTTISSIVDKEIREWVEGEGGLALIRKFKRKEDMIQKLFKIQIENALLRRGLRKMDITREPELLNGYKPDLTISYGFIGKVMIEIKPTYNSEASPENVKTHYRKKLLDYMNGTRSSSAIFLLFQVDSNHPKLKNLLPKLRKIFLVDHPKILVEGLNCVSSINE